jgi:hypothetical protein
VTVTTNQDGSFNPGTWVDLKYPGSTGVTSANSVAGNQVVGISSGNPGVISYQVTIGTVKVPS